MSSAIQDTIKALVEFEAELESARLEAVDSKKKVVKDAGDWAASAKSSALSKAQQFASERLAKAKAEAEKQAEAIRAKGQADLKNFESSISRRKTKAAEYVVGRLLGVQQ